MATGSTESLVKDLSGLKRDEGIRRLSTGFQWTEYEGDEQRRDLHQEFVYESVMCSIKRGLPWSAVAQVANMAKGLLPRLKGLETPEATSLIRTQLSDIQPKLSPAHRAALQAFIVKDYVHHQRLYQAFLKGETNLKSTHSRLEVQIPPQPPRLCEGTDAVMWEKQPALRELMGAEAEKRAEIQRLQEQAETLLTEKLKARLDDLPLEDRIDKREVKTIARAFLKSQGEMIKDLVMKEITAAQELLELRLGQTSLLMGGHSSDTSSFSGKLSASGSKKLK